jgi:trk system potassium uptake protein TrkA
MKIIIAGAGKVGFELARSLSSDHDVTVIDKNAEALDRLSELIDIYPVTGDIENPAVYRTLLDDKADIFIAVTDSDEANILSTLLANDSVEIGRKIIRLRNAYFKQSRFLAEIGNLERISPLQLSAETVRLLLDYPGANNVKQFSQTDTKLISVQVDNPNYEEKQVHQFENDRLKIVGVERDRLFSIPTADAVVRHGDLLYFLGDGAVLEQVYGQLDLHMPQQIKSAVVFGADMLGVEVARILIEKGVRVKVIEKSIDLCRIASDQLQDKALVVNSHYDEAILYAEEDLGRADMVITTDRKDEINIVRALQAKEHAIPKVVAINNERKYYPLMHQLGMVVARGPRTSAYYAILESIARDAVGESRHFCGGAGVVLARYIAPDSPLIGILPPRWRSEGIVLIERAGDLITGEQIDAIEAGDVLFLIVNSSDEKQGRAWIYSL